MSGIDNNFRKFNFSSQKIEKYFRIIGIFRDKFTLSHETNLKNKKNGKFLARKKAHINNY